MGIFNKFKQAKELAKSLEDPQACRFAMTYDLIQSGYDSTISNYVSHIMFPLDNDLGSNLNHAVNPDFKNNIVAVSRKYAVSVGTVRKSVPVELTIEDAQMFMLINGLRAVDQYIKYAQIVRYDNARYPKYSEWLEIKQAIEEAGYTSN